ncbi:MAG: hypothetical protein V4613_07320 [Bacteroidota bacterium]
MKRYSVFLIIILLMNACSKDNSASYENAFAITNCNKINNPGSGFAKIQLTVVNNSQLTGGCWAYVKIKKGNTIIETGTMIFSSLNPGESQIEEAWFSKFDSHSEYDRAEVTLNWNIDSTGYSRNYSY